MFLENLTMFYIIHKNMNSVYKCRNVFVTTVYSNVFEVYQGIKVSISMNNLCYQPNVPIFTVFTVFTVFS